MTLYVYSRDRTVKYVYRPYMSECPGAQGLHIDEIRRLADVDGVRCPEVFCQEKLHFRSPDQKVKGHWRHNPGSACVRARQVGYTAEGEWHDDVKSRIFGTAAHEVALGNSRADVLVTDAAGDRWAVEVQHSSMSYEVALTRMRDHRRAGCAGTLWLMDAESPAMGVPADLMSRIEGDDFNQATAQKVSKGYAEWRGDWWNYNGGPNQRFRGGVLGLPASEVCRAASDPEMVGYRSPVVLLRRSHTGNGFRGRVIVEGRWASDLTDSGFEILTWGAFVLTGTDLRDWASGAPRSQRVELSLDTWVDDVTQKGPDSDRTYVRIDGDIVRVFSTVSNPLNAGHRHRPTATKVWNSMAPVRSSASSDDQTCDCGPCEYRANRGLGRKHLSVREKKILTGAELKALILSVPVASDAMTGRGRRPPRRQIAFQILHHGVAVSSTSASMLIETLLRNRSGPAAVMSDPEADIEVRRKQPRRIPSHRHRESA